MKHTPRLLSRGVGKATLLSIIPTLIHNRGLKEIFERVALLMTRLETLPLLPENAIVNRASGDYKCEICGKIFYNHPQYAYPSLMNSVILGCDGIYYHL